MKLIVGLGNPGSKYNSTRHNIGFMVVDGYAQSLDLNINGKEKNALVAKTNISGEKVIFAKPQTFMNNSGQAVRALADYYNISSDEIIIIYDDLDLNVGQIRVKTKGGHGGHNGIKSIINHLGTKDFNRLRIGIGRPEYGTVVDYVLGRFSKKESDIIENTLDKVKNAIDDYLRKDINQVMNRYN